MNDELLFILKILNKFDKSFVIEKLNSSFFENNNSFYKYSKIVLFSSSVCSNCLFFVSFSSFNENLFFSKLNIIDEFSNIFVFILFILFFYY